jgi:hypothetical protein
MILPPPAFDLQAHKTYRDAMNGGRLKQLGAAGALFFLVKGLLWLLLPLLMYWAG